MIIVERMAYADFIAKGRILYVPHYLEVPYASGKLEQDIDHSLYLAREAAGELHIFVAKDGNQLVGYMAITIEPLCHHSGKLRAVTDTFYVLPQYRGRGVMKLMTDAVEIEAAVGGVAAVQVVTNANFSDAEAVATSLGYRKLETTWVKEL